jgi:chromosome segregation ATPase
MPKRPESVTSRALRRGTAQVLRVAAAKKRLNRMRLGQDLRELDAEKKEAMTELNANGIRINNLRRHLEDLELTNTSLQNKRLMAKRPTTTATGIIDYRKVSRKSVPSSIKTAQKKLATLTREREKLTREISELEGDMNQIRNSQDTNNRDYARYDKWQKGIRGKGRVGKI